MSIITDFLKLFKYDPETDGASTFNIKQCLNDNWDKIDAWASGIKTTIAGLVPGTRKINNKALSADVTLTGDDIKTSASDETTISSQLSNTALSSHGILQDVNILDWAITRKRSGAFTSQPGCTGVPNSSLWYAGNLFVNIAASAWSIILIEASSMVAWYNATESGVWKGWKPIATATPPQEFDLPLADGYTANGGCKYSKDQFGIVRVVGNINKSSGTFASNTPFATLPAGFRPGRYGGFVAIANSLPVEVSKRHPAVVQVSVDGNISISMMSETDQTAFQQIVFAIQFFAAD